MHQGLRGHAKYLAFILRAMESKGGFSQGSNFIRFSHSTDIGVQEKKDPFEVVSAYQ